MMFNATQLICTLFLIELNHGHILGHTRKEPIKTNRQGNNTMDMPLCPPYTCFPIK